MHVDILAWLLEKLHALRNAIMNFMNIWKIIVMTVRMLVIFGVIILLLIIGLLIIHIYK